MSQRDRSLARDFRGVESRTPDAYRRGFLHGARAACGAANHMLPPAFARRLQDWLVELEGWGANNRYGEHAPRPPWRDEP